MDGALFVKDGKERFFIESKFQQAIDAGWIPKEDLVLQGDDGTLSTVSPELTEGFASSQPIDASKPTQQRSLDVASDEEINRQAALRESREQFEGPLGQGRKFFLNVGRGATANLIDPLLTTETGGLSNEDLLAASEGGVALAGQLVGMIGPAFATGGGGIAGLARATPAGLIASGGRKIAGSTASKVAGFTAAGAFEGAAFGAGQAVSNLTLSDKELTAEAVISEVGLNILYGGALGGAGGLVGGGLEKLGSKVLSRKKLSGVESDLISDNLANIGVVANNHFDEIINIQDDLLNRVAAVRQGRRPLDSVAQNNVRNTVVGKARKLENYIKAKGLEKEFSKELSAIRKLQEEFSTEVLTLPGLGAQRTPGAQKLARETPLVPDEILGAASKPTAPGKLQEIIDVDSVSSEIPKAFPGSPKQLAAGQQGLQVPRNPALIADEILSAPRAAQLRSRQLDIIDAKAWTVDEVISQSPSKLAKQLKELDSIVDDVSAKSGLGRIPLDETVTPQSGPSVRPKGERITSRESSVTDAINSADTAELNAVANAERKAQDALRAKFNRPRKDRGPKHLARETDQLPQDVLGTKQVRSPFAKFAELEKQVKSSQEEFFALVGNKDNFQNFLNKDFDEGFEALAILDRHHGNLKKLATEFNDGELLAKIDNLNVKLNESVAGLVPENVSKLDIAEMLTLLGISEVALPNFEGPYDDILKLFVAYKLANKGGLVTTKAGTAARKAGFGDKLQKIGKSAAASGGRQAGFNVAPRGEGIKGAVKAGVAASLGAKLFGGVFDVITKGSQSLGNATGRAVSRVHTALGKTLKGTGKTVRRATPLGASKILQDFSLGGEVPKKETPAASLVRITNQLDNFVNNPEGTAQFLHEMLTGLRQVNSEVGDQMYGKLNNAAAFLQSKLPRDPGILQRFGKSTWKPTKEQTEQFARYIRAAHDPAGIVERFASQQVTREDWEVLEQLYPKHYLEVNKWMANNMELIQDKWSYEYRMLISRLNKQAVDPVAQNNWQESFSVAADAQQAKQQPPQGQSTGENTMAQQLSGGGR